MQKTFAQVPHDQSITFTAELGTQTVRVVSRPGIPHWDRVSPAQRLLAEGAMLRSTHRILHFGCGHGALGVALARMVPGGSVDLIDASSIATALAAETLAENGITNAQVLSDPAVLDGAYDAAIVDAPAGRKFARRWLAQAHAVLRPGGHLYVAGPKDEGIESLVRDIKDLCGQGSTLSYREHNRVGIATKATGEHPLPTWATEPGVAPGTWHHFTAKAAGRSFAIDSLPGIFSYDRLDEGSALLIEALATRVPAGGRVLDLGCGYGILGLVAAALGAGRADLVDISLPAIAATTRNIAANDLPNAVAIVGDGLGAVPGERYDLIVTNPPFHTGKVVDFESARRFMRESAAALNPHGQILLVANAFLPYDAVLRERYRRVEQVVATPRFQVLRAAEPLPPGEHIERKPKERDWHTRSPDV